MTQPAPGPNKNGSAMMQALGGLLSSPDSATRLIAIALILVSGAGNWFATQRNGDQNREEVQRTVHEIHDLHASLDDTISRQKHIVEMLEKLTSKP